MAQSSADSKDILKHTKPGIIPGEASFLEMLDILNDSFSQDGKEPVAFDHDCREAFAEAAE